MENIMANSKLDSAIATEVMVTVASNDTVIDADAPLTALLARYAVSTRLDLVPEDVRERARIVLVDELARREQSPGLRRATRPSEQGSLLVVRRECVAWHLRRRSHGSRGSLLGRCD